MTQRLLSLTLAAGLLFGVTACDDDEITRPIDGTVVGTVTAGAEGIEGVTLMLDGEVERTTLTGPAGNYEFLQVPAGMYDVRITDAPAGITFSTMEKTITITTSDPEAVADFDGTVTGG